MAPTTTKGLKRPSEELVLKFPMIAPFYNKQATVHWQWYLGRTKITPFSNQPRRGLRVCWTSFEQMCRPLTSRRKKLARKKLCPAQVRPKKKRRSHEIVYQSSDVGGIDVVRGWLTAHWMDQAYLIRSIGSIVSTKLWEFVSGHNPPNRCARHGTYYVVPRQYMCK